VGRSILITGGAGFIGANYARRRLGVGDRVVVFDNLSRPGSDRNLQWIRAGDRHGRLQVVVADVRDRTAVDEAVRSVDEIVHLAGQVSVVESLRDPVADFDVNAGGTLNVIDAARRSPHRPAIVYASTNKVYGSLEGYRIVEHTSRHLIPDLPFGIDEDVPFDVLTPYACSKGAGDLYVQDAWSSFQIPTVVFRQSCIYGPRQLGCEEQGWVSWLVAATVTGRKITVFGDGKQVRDLLWVDDLLDAYDLAFAKIDEVAGSVFNIGGGPELTLSIWEELGPLLKPWVGSLPEVSYRPWRPSDQRVFVSDVRRVSRVLGWHPRVDVKDGLAQLVVWIRDHLDLLETASL